LSEEEIKVCWEALERPVMNERPADVLRLCILTGQRVGEVAGIAVDEIDPKCTLWRLPAARSKNGRAHSIPLVGLAVDIVGKWRSHAREARQAHLFQTVHGNPMQATNIGNSLDRARGEMGLPHFTAHDLRRTVASHMARLGIDRVTIGAALNHLSTTKSG